MQRLVTAVVICTSILMGLVACVRNQPRVIVITATFLPETSVPQEAGSTNQIAPATPSPTLVPTTILPTLALSQVPDNLPNQPTPNSTRPVATIPDEYVVQSGDSLSAIAARFNVSLDALIELNGIENPNLLSVGEVLTLPDAPDTDTSTFKIIPDGRLVRGPGSTEFDIAAFIEIQPGFIHTATDGVSSRLADGANFEETLTAAQIVERVSLEYSVDARLLLAILEYRANWLSRVSLPEETQTHPLISEADSGTIDRAGLYKQLAWAANELNRGYYGWKYRNATTIAFQDGLRLRYGEGLNAGTIGVQYFLSLNSRYANWQQQVSRDGLFSTYYAYFGNPFEDVIDPLIPLALAQPPLTLPFVEGEIWRFTGGAHGGWGSGSAWASLDFAPPDEREDGSPFCYISEHSVNAVAAGVIAHNSGGSLILDLDGDGDEATGWTILYLHLSTENGLTAGTPIVQGQALGRASCRGGFSTATHLHIARRYNGEWLPADCLECITGQEPPPFVMSGWEVIGLVGQEYQGFLQNGNNRAVAEQGRNTTINQVSW